MKEPAHLVIPSASTQNGDMMIEVGIDELKADLSRYLQAVQDGHEVLIKDGDRPVARLLPEPEPFTIIPPRKSMEGIDKIPYFRPKDLKPGDLDEAIRRTKADWIGRRDE